MRDKVVLKINLFGLGSKRMVSMATRSVILLKMGLDLQTQSYLRACLS